MYKISATNRLRLKLFSKKMVLKKFFWIALKCRANLLKKVKKYGCCKFKPCFSQKTPKISNENGMVNLHILALENSSKMLKNI